MSIDAKHFYRFEYLKSDRWQNVRLQALVREEGKCQVCGEESIFNDAHHVWYPENIEETTINHLVILCRDCHALLHALLPCCKTSDDELGRSYWITFRNAVEKWRRAKGAALFKGTEPVGPAADLRKAYKQCQRRCDELHTQLQKASMPASIEHQANLICHIIKGWSFAARGYVTSGEKHLEDSDYEI